VHLFVMDGSVGTRTDHSPETAMPDSRTNTFAWLKGAKQRPRCKAKKREAFIEHGERAFREAALATAGPFGHTRLVCELKSALRRLFIGNQEYLETPPWDCILSGFPTTTATDWLLNRPVETPIPGRSRNRDRSRLALPRDDLPRPVPQATLKLHGSQRLGAVTLFTLVPNRRCCYGWIRDNQFLVGSRSRFRRQADSS
jgi:hypothetical protein